MRSKITDKFQTTVPKKIRESLKLSRNDYIEWKNEDPCNCTAYTSDRWTYGFPIDFQLKVGKLLRKK